MFICTIIAVFIAAICGAETNSILGIAALFLALEGIGLLYSDELEGHGAGALLALILSVTIIVFLYKDKSVAEMEEEIRRERSIPHEVSNE